MSKRAPSHPLDVFAAQALNKETRLSSSSGGIFSTLAQNILSQGGFVSGAGWSGDLTVAHKIVDDKKKLDDLKRSKYVQSRIGDTFKKIKLLLEENKPVLFVGCPCQVAGLLQYLAKPFEHLHTVDLICHGVNSVLAWKKYLAAREAQFNSHATAVNFRSKDSGWTPNHLITIDFENGNRYKRSADTDYFFRAFLADRIAQPCCYNCAFRNQKSGSDLTIGDFWGVEGLITEFRDGLGTSAILVNTAKGKSMLNAAINNLKIIPSSFSDVTKGNFVLERSCHKPRKRGRLFAALKAHDFDTAFLLTEKPTLLDALKPIGCLIMHVAWWLKRLIVNHEVNRF